MSNIFDYLLLIRGVERLFIVLGGMLSICCGMLLYKWGTSGVCQLKLDRGETKFRLVNAGPGLVLGLLGIAVFLYALFSRLEFSLTPVDVASLSKVQSLTFSYDRVADKSLGKVLRDFRHKDFTKIADKEGLLVSIHNFQESIGEFLDNEAKGQQSVSEKAKAKQTTIDH